MKLYLIGLPGSGKSFLGKQLADALKLPFIDLDKIIENESGGAIGRIFSEKGEEYFRTLEAAALRQQSKKPEFVMACGGGTPCFHDNMIWINETGMSLFVDTPLVEIVSRMNREEANTRPLLTNEKSVEARLQKLLQERRPVYEQAHVVIEGSTLPLNAVIEKIRSFKKHNPQ